MTQVSVTKFLFIFISSGDTTINPVSDRSGDKLEKKMGMLFSVSLVTDKKWGFCDKTISNLIN